MKRKNIFKKEDEESLVTLVRVLLTIASISDDLLEHVKESKEFERLNFCEARLTILTKTYANKMLFRRSSCTV